MVQSSLSRTFPKLVLRLPPDVKEWIAAKAERNAGSQNSEIVRVLRDQMERETAAAQPR
jgi:hypothetical protein